MSFGLSDLQYLMQQLGPAMPEITTIIQEDRDSWQVELDEALSLQLCWQEQPPRIRMRCAIARPDDDVLLAGEYEVGDASLDTLRRLVIEFLTTAGQAPASASVAGSILPVLPAYSSAQRDERDSAASGDSSSGGAI